MIARQLKLCHAADALVASLIARDPNFTIQQLNQFLNEPLLTELMPTLGLLLNYFGLDAMVNGNFSVRQ